MSGEVSRAAVVRDSVFGAGLGVVAGGAALGIYSRWVAEPQTLHDYRNHAEIVGVPERIALWSVVGGIWLIGVVIATVAVPWVARRAGSVRDSTLIRLSVVGVCGALVYILVDSRLWAVWTEVRRSYPYRPVLPAAVAALVLVLVGAIVMVTWMFRAKVHAGRAFVARGVVVGLVFSAGVAFAAFRLGDDSVNIDRVVAERTEVDNPPERLGEEKFRIHGDPLSRYAASPMANIAIAGSGFVISDRLGVTAYDGRTGTPRWHYRRIAQDGYQLFRNDGSLRMVGEDVVLVTWEHIDGVALDAHTGATLWSDSDFLRDRRSMEWRDYHHSGDSLVLGRSDRIAGYDARTGRKIWETPTAQAECFGPGTGSISDANIAATRDTIYTEQTCGAAPTAWKHLTALDPATGAVLAARDIHVPDAYTSLFDIQAHRNMVDVSWRSDTGATAGFRVLKPSDLLAATVDEKWWKMRDAFVDIDPSATDVLTQHPIANTSDWISEVTSVDGVPRYRLAGNDFRSPSGLRAFLTEEIVETEPGRNGEVHTRSWSRRDGTRVSDRTIAGCERPEKILAGPGSLLVVCSARDGGLDIIGFD